MRLNLAEDWEHVVYVRLLTSEAITCPICMSTNSDLFLPKILRCHHILCLPCLLTYYVDCKQCCPLCNRNICLREIRRIEIDSRQVLPGDTIDVVLLRKDIKTFHIEYKRPGIAKEENFDDFLSHTKWAPESRYEAIFLADLQSIYEEAQVRELDPLITEFCEFIQMKALEKCHAAEKQTPQLGRKAVKPQISKKGEYILFYQMKEGFNVFLHPLDMEYLLRDAKFNEEMLQPILLVN